MTDRELMQQALDALMTVTSGVPDTWDGVVKASQAIEALRARLAQPEPEQEQRQRDMPCIEDDGCPTEKAVLQRFWRKHQQREWQGLTDDELAEFSEVLLGNYDLCLEVEAKLKEKNT